MRLLVWGALLLLGCTAPESQSNVFVDLELPEHFPEPQVPSDNPLTSASIELGRHLFYDSRLSSTNTLSCSSCHKQEFAFADDRPTSLGATGEVGVLNAPSLANVIYAAPLTWAHGHIDRIEDQLLGPMFGQSPLEMGMLGAEEEIMARLRADTRYQSLFEAAYPEQGMSLEVARFALASFVRSLVSGSAPFDSFLQGDQSAISAEARRGSELFYSERLGCANCHAGFGFSTAVASGATAADKITPFHNIGLYDIDGQGAYPAQARGLIEESGLPGDMGRFRVPSLRNVALTAPYGHDGSVATLEDFIRMYEEGGRVLSEGVNAGDARYSPLRSAELADFELSDDEAKDLIRFLESLSDDDFVSDARHSNPW